LRGVLQSEEANGLYTTDLDRTISLKPIKTVQEKREQGESQSHTQSHTQSLNLLPSGESEDEDRGKRKKTGYCY
jgi:hypothetical protein